MTGIANSHGRPLIMWVWLGVLGFALIACSAEGDRSEPTGTSEAYADLPTKAEVRFELEWEHGECLRAIVVNEDVVAVGYGPEALLHDEEGQPIAAVRSRVRNVAPTFSEMPRPFETVVAIALEASPGGVGPEECFVLPDLPPGRYTLARSGGQDGDRLLISGEFSVTD